MAEDPRSTSSWVNRLLRRPQQPTPVAEPPTLFEPPAAAEPKKRTRRSLPGQMMRPGIDVPAKIEPSKVRTPFYTGQEPRKARSRSNRTTATVFEEQSGSGRIKREQEFERRFKGEVARAEARLAIEDAAVLTKAVQQAHIERMREWKDDLRFLVSGRLPVPAEAGFDINRRHEALFDRYDREIKEIQDELKLSLGWAESLDLAEDKRRQKLLGYTPNRPRDFQHAAVIPEPPQPRPGNAQDPAKPSPRTVLDHPFNDAVTQPESTRPALEYTFNDAVTAPDPLAEHLARFRAAAQPQDQPPLAPLR